MEYHKLVRDKIPEYIRAKGGLPIFHVASEGEYWAKLVEKLKEETSEFAADPSLEELADVLEVVDAVLAHQPFIHTELLKIRKKKAEERGIFKDYIILDES